MLPLSNKQRERERRKRAGKRVGPDIAIAVAQTATEFIEPTKERLRHAQGYAIWNNKGAIRVVQSPLAMLHARGALDRLSSDRNDTLFAAGQRYFKHWYLAGLSPVGAMDMARAGGGDGNPAWATPNSESIANHRSEYILAGLKLGGYLKRWVDAIVIEEREPAEAGRDLTGRMDAQTSAAIAIEILRGGLTTLAEHWGIFGRRG